MKKIKILRIIARLNIGGPAIHTILLTEGLRKEEFNSLLICGNTGKNEGDMAYLAYEKKVRPIFIPELRREVNLYRDLVAFIKIFKIILREQPDIIHTHTAKAGTLGRLGGIIFNLFSKKSSKSKIIHTFHGHVLSGYFGSFKTRYYILIEKFLAAFSTKVITVSESVKNELVALGICDRNKIEVIPLGLELDNFLGIESKEHTTVKIGILGRLVPIKNHKLFLDTVSLILKSNPKASFNFRIIGDGELKSQLQIYSKILGLNRQVEFLGWRRDLDKVYSGLDIVVLTSKNEGTPVSLIEAMASAKAVVATDVGGIRDLLGDINREYEFDEKPFLVLERGILVKAQNPESFSSALLFAAENMPLRIKMGESARGFVANRFSKKRLISDMCGLYYLVLSRQ